MNHAESAEAIRRAVEALVASGYKTYPGGLDAQADVYLQRRLRRDAPTCLTNDGVYVDVEIFDMSRYGDTPPKANVEIVGEYRTGMWTKLQVYSVSLPLLLTDIGHIENELLDAWVALTKARMSGAGAKET